MRTNRRRLLSSSACAAAALIVAAGAVQAAPTAAPTLAQCNGAKDLVFVAHLDDDLLFMNPDLEATIAAGGCVRVVYLTASERGEGEGYMMGRERGVRAAYAYMAGAANRWTQSAVRFHGTPLARFVLDQGGKISLLHMRIKDPWLGSGWGSLTPLSRAESVPGAQAWSLGPYVHSYTRDDLVATLAAIIDDYRPTTVRHMDDTIGVAYTALCWRCAGHDHPDHIASARLARDALRRATGNYAEVGYVDYPTQERAPNLTEAEIAAKSNIFRQYAANDYRYCPGPASSCKEPAGTAASWVGRAYYVSRRAAPAALVPDAGGGCSLFAVGELNRAVNVRSGADWTALGGRTADPIAAFSLADGRAGILARDATGRLWTNAQSADHSWTGWLALTGTRFVGLPAIAANADGRTAIVALGNDGAFHYAAQETGAGYRFSRWSALPPLARVLPDAAAALDANGRLALFAADRDGNLWVASQTGPGADSWTTWRRLSAAATSGGLAAMRNRHGLIELYLRDWRSGHMLRFVQSRAGSPQGPWSGARNLGFAYMGRPAIAVNEKGGVAVAALGIEGGTIWLAEGPVVSKLGVGASSAPALALGGGVLHAAARGNQVAQTYLLWTRTAAGWHALAPAPAPPAFGGGSFVEASVPGSADPFKAPILSAGLGPGHLPTRSEPLRPSAPATLTAHVGP